VKLTRRTGRTRIIAAQNAFHGRTTGALALTWKEAYRAPFEPLMPGVTHVPYNDEDALRAGLERDQPACAVLDVFQTEPLPTDSWLWDHPKVRVSAHTSNSGDGNLGRGDELFLENLRRYLAQEPLLNEADPSEVGLPARA